MGTSVGVVEHLGNQEDSSQTSRGTQLVFLAWILYLTNDGVVEGHALVKVACADSAKACAVRIAC